MKSNLKTTIILAGAAVLAIALGIWGYNAYKTHELRKAVAALLADSGMRLREALEIEAGTAPIDRRKSADRNDAFATATEKTMAQMKRLDLGRDRAFGDAAESHLLTMREIFRRRAASHRFFLLQDDSVGALEDHMKSDNRTGTWVKRAVQAKERAERDFRDYQLTVAAYATLLEAFPTSQNKIAGRVEPAALVDEALVMKARERALESARQSEKEMQAARNLLGAR